MAATGHIQELRHTPLGLVLTLQRDTITTMVGPAPSGLRRHLDQETKDGAGSP